MSVSNCCIARIQGLTSQSPIHWYSHDNGSLVGAVRSWRSGSWQWRPEPGVKSIGQQLTSKSRHCRNCWIPSVLSPRAKEKKIPSQETQFELNSYRLLTFCSWPQGYITSKVISACKLYFPFDSTVIYLVEVLIFQMLASILFYLYSLCINKSYA